MESRKGKGNLKEREKGEGKRELDLHRLEIFVKVAELKSFTLAAEALRLSQPTVSEHIRTLEEMAGETLVDRLGRELRLTPAGQILHRYAVKLLHLREEALQALAAYRGELAGRVVIGASTIPGSYLLPQIMGAFKNKHPTVQITLKIANTAAVGEMVLKGEAGLGLVGSRLPEKRLSFEEVYLDELTLAVAPEHPWAARGEVEPAELYGAGFYRAGAGLGNADGGADDFGGARPGFQQAEGGGGDAQYRGGAAEHQGRGRHRYPVPAGRGRGTGLR